MHDVLPGIAMATELGMGLLFLFAATRKWFRPQRLQTGIVALGFKRGAAIFWLVVATEFALGISLVSELHPMFTVPVTVIVLLGFTALLLRLEAIGVDDDCGCFGDSDGLTRRIRPRTRNIVLLLALVGCMGVRHFFYWETGEVRLFAGIVAGCGVVGVTAVLMIKQDRALAKRWDIQQGDR